MSAVIGILFLAFLGYRNSIRAKQNGQNAILWAFLTIVAYIVFEMVGLVLVIVLFCRSAVDFSLFTKADSVNSAALMQKFSDQLQLALMERPERGLLVFASGIGGYLMIRYLLERKTNKKGPEVHWMDKMGQQ